METLSPGPQCLRTPERISSIRSWSLAELLLNGCVSCRQKINFSVVFASQRVGLGEVADEVWQVTFREYDLGYFDK